MEVLTWEEFEANVRGWSEARGIYKHSTATAQALKACSEAGELCDAIVKGEADALEDAVGDVAVCLVNVAEMSKAVGVCSGGHSISGSLEESVGSLLGSLGELLRPPILGDVGDSLSESYGSLHSVCFQEGLDLMACCTKAWNEIKDRKGHMVKGGAFVKEE